MFRSSLALLVAFTSASLDASEPSPYARLVLEDGPVAYWSFDAEGKLALRSDNDPQIIGQTIVGNVKLGTAGPQPTDSDIFRAGNTGVHFAGSGGSIRVHDKADDGPLDFGHGDDITLEAWVNVDRLDEPIMSYLLSKGRTFKEGVRKDNQNYSLRLRPIGGSLRVCFLFRGVDKKGVENWYRWNTDSGLLAKSGWHHVAVTYTFGKKTDPVAYIDGRKTGGFWDMGSRNEATPVSDNDDLWIGSSMGQARTSNFYGRMDEVAIYKRTLTEDRIRRRVRLRPPAPPLPETAAPTDRVLVEVFEHVPVATRWDFKPEQEHQTGSYSAPAFAFTQVARKYNAEGVRVDRTRPFMLRTTSRIELPAGSYQFLLRARNGARLVIDGDEVMSSPFHTRGSGAHQDLPDYRKVKQAPIRQLQTGDRETLQTVTLSEGRHEFRLDLYLGGKGDKRPEIGETSLSYRPAGADNSVPFTLLTPQSDWKLPLTEDGWDQFTDLDRVYYRRLNQARRRDVARDEDRYWARRHAEAKRLVESTPAPTVPRLPDGYSAHNPIDNFLADRLAAEDRSQQPLVDDATFARRVTLDVLGLVPTPEQLATFEADTSPKRRANFVRAILAEDGYADHWVSYWQDVLAENPNVINPTLNNTGPFRWWLYESFLDRKPVDRFVTELVSMRGSTHYGAPGGFSIASQNDAPMAAKAHIVSQAFLGVDLKCARCHDSPFSDRTQEDLFNVAAMLNRGPQAVPKTSTVPTGGSNSLLIEVNLTPGQKIAPLWPFEEIMEADPDDIFVRDGNDSRERLAAMITSPTNERFAKVVVNRLWQRLMGRGLVEPVDDWDAGTASHPELIDWLARELMTHGYRLQHVTELILTSRAYQSRVDTPSGSGTDDVLFAGPQPRRLTAEQIVDSLFVAAGKRFRAGEMCIDADGSRSYKQSLNLGRPHRAWMFASMSNERDRPSLTLPHVAPFVTTLETFGWRSSRQNPVTVRESDPTVLQPAILSNGILGKRFTTLSEDSAFTRIALEAGSVDEFVTRVYRRTLTREPTAAELEAYRGLLTAGFADRVRTGMPLAPIYRDRSTGVSWTNHLDPEATERQVALAEEVARGEAPTNRLQEEWRMRAEDMLWAILNSPEFVFMP